MATLAELPLRYRLSLTAYPWRRLPDGPWPALDKPLQQARLAVVTSAGLYHPERDRPFASTPGGDCTVRWIEGSDPLDHLTIGQRSRLFDRAAMTRDRNEAFPLDRTREMVAEGRLGSLAQRHPSINGSITAPGRLVRDTAPTIAAALHADRVDAALLVPV